MVFSSLLFLFAFLPLALLLYAVSPKRWKNKTLLLISYAFYAWGAPKFVFVLFLSSTIDFLLTKWMKRQKKWALALGLVLNLGVLGYAKYANFFVAEFNKALEIFGMTGIHWTTIALPIGISFFTFQKISYLVDVYRGTTKPAQKYTDYLLYVALFPQLIAGPIVRYHEIADQIRSRVHTRKKVWYGAWRFCLGLGKKVLIADMVGQAATVVFGLDQSLLLVSYAWVGALCYAMQIYFDFSGYSDMAIGLGYMFGFTFPENFNMPYIARSITEFWRRWHMTLSAWMKEYLYIPLGGNRVSRSRMFVNLWTVFLLSGLWHGAAWTFVIWGAYHGFFLVIDKLWWLKKGAGVHGAISTLLTFVIVLIGWVFFRSPDVHYALMFVQRMFDLRMVGELLPEVIWTDFITNRTWTMLGIGVLISFLPALPLWQQVASGLNRRTGNGVKVLSQGIVMSTLFVLSAIALASTSFHPFIYFMF